MLKQLWQKQATKKVIYLIVLLLMLYFIKPMFNLFLLTFLLAYFVDTTKMFIVDKLSRFVKISPKLIIFGIYMFIVLILGFVITKYIPAAVNESAHFIHEASNLKFTESKYITKILEQVDVAKYTHMGVNSLVEGATNIGKWAVNIFLSLILSLFFVLQKDEIKDFIRKFKHSRVSGFYEYMSYFGKSFMNSFAKVIQAQILIAVVNTGFSLIGLSVIGFKNLIALGFMIFILSLIPVAGVIISLIPLCLIAFQLGGIIKVVYVLVMIAVIHAFESYVLNPKLMSNKTNLPVFFTFVILIVSEHFMGTWGLLLGIPIVIFVLDMLGVNLESDKKQIKLKINKERIKVNKEKISNMKADA
ncbi:AI-2E family transporter [Clostridium sp. MB40-C1]|uniref:AI-2E family transporter n=1 Tax=Clostridium sp. MB40-C1 TaxID=3070996 RepID=UPI0027E1728F|nr:AI-2E family transporter [Clostridium sp. MB40-C1]WMJ79460.1 AI-2E family transporter [Clostridium sp. MB40-C1]